MKKVYVVQKQMKYDNTKEMFVPKFDMEPAKEYGRLEFLLSPTAQPFSPLGIVQELHDKLQYFTQEDYLLLIGNPCLIGMTVAIASYYADGKVKMLQWSGKEQRYVEIDATLFDFPDENKQ